MNGPSNIWISQDKTQAFAQIGIAAMCATGSPPMTDATCREVVAAMAEAHKTRPIRCGIQFSPTQSPNSVQRQIFAEQFNKHGIFDRRVAIVSQSILVRGAVTAMQWISTSSVQTRAFAPGDIRAALKWIAEIGEFSQADGEALLRQVVTAVGLSMA